MSRLIFALASLLVFPALAQYAVEPAGPCSAEGVADSVKATLEAGGHRVKDPGGAVYVEVWLNKAIPIEKGGEARGSDFSMLTPGTMVGVIRYAKAGADFRGQAIQPGVYTMRFNLQPEDGDHQGASPRRDHLLLAPVAADPDTAAKPNFDAAVALSRKASGTQHPSVLFLLSPDSGAKFPSMNHAGNRDILQVKSGSLALGITVAGKAEE